MTGLSARVSLLLCVWLHQLWSDPTTFHIMYNTNKFVCRLNATEYLTTHSVNVRCCVATGKKARLLTLATKSPVDSLPECKIPCDLWPGLTLYDAGSQICSFSKRTEETTVVDISLQLEVQEIPGHTDVSHVCYMLICTILQYCHCRPSYQIDEWGLADVDCYHVMWSSYFHSIYTVFDFLMIRCATITTDKIVLFVEQMCGDTEDFDISLKIIRPIHMTFSVAFLILPFFIFFFATCRDFSFSLSTSVTFPDFLTFLQGQISSTWTSEAESTADSLSFKGQCFHRFTVAHTLAPTETVKYL